MRTRAYVMEAVSYLDGAAATCPELRVGAVISGSAEGKQARLRASFLSSPLREVQPKMVGGVQRATDHCPWHPPRLRFARPTIPARGGILRPACKNELLPAHA